jgi:hypothetical protein
MIVPATSSAGEVGEYHSYHNRLAGNLIALPACEKTFVDDGTGRTVLDVADDVLNISTDSPSFWVYDGLRTWNVGRTVPSGGYNRYVFEDSDCVLYSNSISVNVLLDVEGVSKTRWYAAFQYSVPR